jgi:hypothetical protein
LCYYFRIVALLGTDLKDVGQESHCCWHVEGLKLLLLHIAVHDSFCQSCLNPCMPCVVLQVTLNSEQVHEHAAYFCCSCSMPSFNPLPLAVALQAGVALPGALAGMLCVATLLTMIGEAGAQPLVNFYDAYLSWTTGMLPLFYVPTLAVVPSLLQGGCACAGARDAICYVGTALLLYASSVYSHALSSSLLPAVALGQQAT